MSATADETSRQSQTVAAASEEASANVQTAAAAAEELSSSIAEISRQVSESTRIANEATEQAGRTNEQNHGLAEAAQRIGDVVSSEERRVGEGRFRQLWNRWELVYYKKN